MMMHVINFSAPDGYPPKSLNLQILLDQVVFMYVKF